MRNDIRALWSPWRWLLCALLSAFPGHGHVAAAGSTDDADFRLIEGLFEPSGVAQLESGLIVAVEDEAARPFSLLRADGDGWHAQPLRSKSLLTAAFEKLADLEGVTAGDDSFVYAITSHSRKENGKRAADRELLVRFEVEDGKLAGLRAVRGLRKALEDAFPFIERAADERNVKRDGGLNIEGLAFDRRAKKLWLGFRGPLVDDHAVLVTIDNPRGIFERGESIQLGNRPVRLDLDGGGVRGLAYDPRLAGYLILSHREGSKKKKPFKLWLWSGDRGDPARRVRIEGVKDLRRAEAVAPIRVDGKEKILLLSDDGDRRRRRAAGFLLADYAALHIDQEPR